MRALLALVLAASVAACGGESPAPSCESADAASAPSAGDPDAAASPDAALDAGACATCTWHLEDSGVKTTLRGVWASSADDVYVVGLSGTSLRSTTRGASWKSLSAGIPEAVRGWELHGIWGTAPDDLHVVGGLLPDPGLGTGDSLMLHTLDRGAAWTADHWQEPWLLYASILHGVWGSGAEAWTVGHYGMVFHSSNGGTSWGPVEIDPSWNYPHPTLNAVWGTGAHLWIAGTYVYHSEDHGLHWKKQNGHGLGLWGTSKDNVYMVGYGGTILHTDNQGLNWLGQVSRTSKQLNAIWGRSATDIWAVGQGGTILHSDDGTTWRPQDSGTTAELFAVFGTGDDVWAVGADGVILHLK